MSRIVLLGSTGQVGYELVRSLSPVAEVLTLGRVQCDLSGPLSLLEDKLLKLSPDMVINAAAFTAVDKAETEPELAFQVNAATPAVLASVCSNLQIPLIHFSTDYVFNGHGQLPWTEEAEPDPINVYGQSKWEGEKAIKSSGVAHLIIRTSWVYGNRGANFLTTMKRLAQEREQLNIVDDQIGAPTWSRHIADAVSQIVSQSSMEGTSFWDKHSGTYHLTGRGQGSWYDFARAIFDSLQKTHVAIPAVFPINSDAYPTPAQRPKFSILDNSKINAHFGIQLPDWEESLRLVMQDAGF